MNLFVAVTHSSKSRKILIFQKAQNIIYGFNLVKNYRYETKHINVLTSCYKSNPISSIKNEMNYPKSTNPFGTPKSTEKDERSREG